MMAGIHTKRVRLEFVQKELNYEVNRDDALDRLRATYATFWAVASRAAKRLRPNPKTSTRRSWNAAPALVWNARLRPFTATAADCEGFC